MTHHEPKNEQLMLAEMQVLLAQLRTQLSILRAGMGLVAGSVSIAFLLFTSNWLEYSNVPWLDLPAKTFLSLLVIVGLWRLLSSERKLHKIHKLIHQMQSKDKLVDSIIV
jgi:uncharacterized membrane protein YidH (DUF202 family)